MCFLLDTRPVPVVDVKRSYRRRNFAGSASYGHCASRSMNYLCYKLVVLTTLDGIPIAYDLMPAHTDEREAAEVVLDYLHRSQIIGDKGFVGNLWKSSIHDLTGKCI